MYKKGIILAGGKGTRLYPITSVVSKQLLPIFDKPMIYYSLSTLMEANIKDILLISSPDQLGSFRDLLGDGSQWGINLSYASQSEPNGIAESFLIGEKFINNENIVLILGDNFYYGIDFDDLYKKKLISYKDANIFIYQVNNPEKYGVVTLDELDENKVISIEEKPKIPKSNYVATGLYFYPPDVVDKVKQLRPSKRGELEITDLNNLYLDQDYLYSTILKNGVVWLDTGNAEDLLEASQFVQTIQHRQKIQIGCPEEIALRNNWININQIEKIIDKLNINSYSNYLKILIK